MFSKQLISTIHQSTRQTHIERPAQVILFFIQFNQMRPAKHHFKHVPNACLFFNLIKILRPAEHVFKHPRYISIFPFNTMAVQPADTSPDQLRLSSKQFCGRQRINSWSIQTGPAETFPYPQREGRPVRTKLSLLTSSVVASGASG